MIEYIVRVYPDRKVWTVKGIKHRVEGPAIEYNDGSYSWWLNGKRHREGPEPSVEIIGKYKSWFKHGIRHREDGPAQIYVNGGCKYFYNGIEYSEELFERIKNGNHLDGSCVKIDGVEYILTLKANLVVSNSF